MENRSHLDILAQNRIALCPLFFYADAYHAELCGLTDSFAK